MGQVVCAMAAAPVAACLLSAAPSSFLFPLMVSHPLGSISHVLFDMDGLLLDTERVYTVVTQRIVERYGENFEWGLKSQMMGRRWVCPSLLLSFSHMDVGVMGLYLLLVAVQSS